MSTSSLIMSAGGQESSAGRTWTVSDQGSNAIRDSMWTKHAVLSSVRTNTIFCVFGDGGNVITSPDGVTWTKRNGLKNSAWGSESPSAVGWSNSTICIFGGYYTQAATSTDNGASWTVNKSASLVTTIGRYPRGIAWNGSIFCAVGQGKAATSSDGITWTNTSSFPTTLSANAVVWNGSIFCAVGDSGRVATSSDGITWTYQDGLRTSSWGTANRAISIIWTGSQFVVSGSGTSIATSPNGVTWTYRAELKNITQWGIYQYPRLAWNGSVITAVAGSTRVATSTNGITWTNSTQLSTTAWGTYDVNTVVNNGSTFLAAGYEGRAATSTDGATWTYQSNLGRIEDSWMYSQSTSIVWTGSVFCVVGWSGKVAISIDGVNWTFQTGLRSTAWGNSNVEKAVWTGTKIWVFGSNKVAESPDGVTWTYRPELSDAAFGDMSSAIWTGSKFVVGSFIGRLASSPDGVNWTYSEVFGAYPKILAASSSKICAIFDDIPTPYTSVDGITWIAHPAINITSLPDFGYMYLTGMVWTGSQFVCAGSWFDNSAYRVDNPILILTSPDGISWTIRNGLSACGWPDSISVTTMVWTGYRLVAAGNNGRMAESFDGITWTLQPSLNAAVPTYISELNWTNSKLIAQTYLTGMAIS